jgi:ABC-type nitrate/sulfonate/bicarbonate transport system permease component
MNPSPEKGPLSRPSSFRLTPIANISGAPGIVLFGSVGITVLFVVWELASLLLQNPVLLPSPFAMLTNGYELLAEGSLLTDIAASLQRVLIGFCVGAGVAVPAALLMAVFTPVRFLLQPVLTLLRPIPPIAWIPIAILWFGIGNGSSYFITAVAAFFPIFINSLSGALAIEPRHINAARCLGANRAALLRYVYLPSCLPMIWTGLEIGLGQSWMAVVTAELVAAQSGLGYMIELNRTQLETSRVFVGMFAIGLIGALMTTGLSRAERLIFPWEYKN